MFQVIFLLSSIFHILPMTSSIISLDSLLSKYCVFESFLKSVSSASYGTVLNVLFLQSAIFSMSFRALFKSLFVILSIFLFISRSVMIEVIQICCLTIPMVWSPKKRTLYLGSFPLSAVIICFICVCQCGWYLTFSKTRSPSLAWLPISNKNQGLYWCQAVAIVKIYKSCLRAQVVYINKLYWNC